jgi:hypothetical protein
MDELTNAMADAVSDSVRRFEQEGPGGDIAAYALVVDGGFQTVYGTCASRQFLEEEGDEAVLLMPFDWDDEDHSPAFERASECLSNTVKAVAADSYEERARMVSGALAGALERARETAPALRDAFLIAVSAGGGDAWQRFEGECVKRLNGPEGFERWAAEFRT